MKFYLAPLESITGYVFRNAYEEFYQDIDKYFTPFISPGRERSFKSREGRDVLPEHNAGMNVVPQILTNRAEDFIRTSEELQRMGYQEVNLNLGCPSGTVVSKYKGAGFLAAPDLLRQFLDEVFRALPPERMAISIKTRIGKNSPDEFPALLELFQAYPVKELIIHPRVQTDFYRNQPNLEVFSNAVENSRIPLVYNGDIFNREQYRAFRERFPSIEAVMLGRGILGRPGLPEECLEYEKNGYRDVEVDSTTKAEDIHRFLEFHDRLLGEYGKVLFGDKTLLHKMKELWYYMIDAFPEHEKLEKKIKKSQHLDEYEAAVRQLLRERERMPHAGFSGSKK